MSRRHPAALPAGLALVAWAALTETGLIHHRAVAAPSDTLRACVAGLADGTLLADLTATGARLGLGLLIGAAFGLPIGAFIGAGPRRRRLLEPGMDFLRAVPPVLVFPLLLMALGYGDAARVGAIAYATLLVITLHVSGAVRHAAGPRTELLRAMGATRRQLLRWVELYELLPSCLTALRHAVSAGIVVAVVTEMVVGAAEGLGSRAVNAQIAYDAAGLYAVVLTTGACGYTLGSLLLALERRIVFWDHAPDPGAENEEPIMQTNLPTIQKRWVALGAVATAMGVAAGLSTQLDAMRAGPVPEPTEGTDRVVDEVRQLFPQTRGWFRIVGTARFATGSGGRIVPDHSSLTHDRVRWEDNAGHTIVPMYAPTFHNATRISSGQDPDIWIDVLPEGGNDVQAEIQDGLVVYPGAYRDTDVLYKSTPTHTDEYLLLRTHDAPTRWTYRVRFGPGIERLRQGGAAVEGVDANGVPWMRGNAPFAIDRNGTRVTGALRVEGDQLIAEIDTHGLDLPILVDPDWRSTGDMSYGRFYFGVNVLPDGRLLATGGCSASRCSGDLSLPACPALVNAAEALDLSTRNWSRVGDGAVRAFFNVSHSLPSGDVLVVGGCGTPDCSGTTGLAEIYDASMSSFRSVDPIPDPNAGQMHATLPDGRVLVAGGCDKLVCSTQAHAFDAGTETWSRLADLNEARGRAEVAVLPDGRVLVTGGCTDISCGGVLASAEVYDPVGDTWDTVGEMSTPRGGHYAVTLRDGRVLVGGGCDAQACPRVLATSELFDPRTDTFTAGSNQQIARFGAAAVRLPDGSVMVNQGCQAATECDLSNEVWNPASGEFHLVEEAITSRAFHETVLHGAMQTVVAVGGCQPATCSWWNESYDVAHLMPADGGVVDPDAGPAPDAGGRDAGSSDAGARMDAGPIPPTDAGCGCDVTRDDTRGLGLILSVLGLLVARRRRTL